MAKQAAQSEKSESGSTGATSATGAMGGLPSQQDWTKGVEDFQSNIMGLWAQSLSAMGMSQMVKPPSAASSAKPAAKSSSKSSAKSKVKLADDGEVVPTPIQLDSEKLIEIQHSYLQAAQDLFKQGFKPGLEVADRRFTSEAWKSNPMASFVAAMYLLNSKTLNEMLDAVEAEPKVKARLAFAAQQMSDAASPANFLALNPEAIRTAVETEGRSIAQGVQNLLHDMRQGHISLTDESAFEVGKNVATTEGAVVFENALFQLIEYKPLGAQVYERPFLFIPPCINKFYILDLQPSNSLIRYVVEQGHRTFVLSWRNPDEESRHVTWDDYVEHAAIEAIKRVQDITGAERINALGFCVGGTILSNALAVLAARKEERVASTTFLTTFVDFSDTGIMDVFIDEGAVRLREKQYKDGGLLSGQDLATTFSFLRPNDLVWNYVQSNYMLGKQPPPFDLLYWNGDSTNLPGPMYAWYLRNTYLENNFIKPGKCVVAGQPIDLRSIKIPTYYYASREDHIVPPQGAFASTKHFGSKDLRYVLGASGHIAGVINPPSANKRSYWTNDKKAQDYESYDDWFASATEHKGSWWSNWSTWLASHAGKKGAAPKSYGSKKYKVIEAAPGRYVQAKACSVLPKAH